MRRTQIVTTETVVHVVDKLPPDPFLDGHDVVEVEPSYDWLDPIVRSGVTGYSAAWWRGFFERHRQRATESLLAEAEPLLAALERGEARAMAATGPLPDDYRPAYCYELRRHLWITEGRDGGLYLEAQVPLCELQDRLRHLLALDLVN